jgi:hypothetical protein
MLELADIVRAVGPQTCAQLALLPSQKRALAAILACRTPALGGQLYECDHCGHQRYSYHSCGNRHCPKCHGEQTRRWLEDQQGRRLPCHYFLLTFTLPAHLRPLARAHQKLVYGLMLRCAAQSVQRLCADPKWVGGQPSLLGVLHTWTRDLRYHPHAHFLVSAGGLSPDGQRWCEPRSPKFLVPVQALSKLFAAKLRDGLHAAGLLDEAALARWKQGRGRGWVVHAQPAGQGQRVLDYLGRYVFRIALHNSRLEKLEHGKVTFRYRDNATQELRHCTLPAPQFLQRFLEHVLPKGLAKVRHYGLDSAAAAARHQQARALLQRALAAPSPEPASPAPTPPPRPLPPPLLPCPACKTGHLICIAQLLPQKYIPP